MPPTTIIVNASASAISVGEATSDEPGRARLVVDGNVEPRSYEVALTCILAAAEGRSLRLPDLGRELAAAPSPAQIRRVIRALERAGLLVLGGDELVQLVGGPTRIIRPSRWEIENARGVVRRIIEHRARRRGGNGASREFEGRIASLQHALLRNDLDEARRFALGPAAATFLTQLEQRTGHARRAELCAVARSVFAETAMQCGVPDQAVHHAEHGLRWLGGRSIPSARSQRVEETAVRLFSTRAAAFRMLAAFDRVRTNEHLKASVESYQLGLDLLESGSALDPWTRTCFTRWLSTAISTPLLLAGDLTSAEQSLDRSEELVSEAANTAADPAETKLIKGRLRLTQESLARTNTSLDRANDEIEGAALLLADPSAPGWILGWLPRYRADLLRLGGTEPHLVLAELLEAWKRSPSLGFQRLVVLSRMAAWHLDPRELELPNERDRADFVASTRQETDFWHRRFARSCRERHRTLLGAIRCVVHFSDDHHPWGRLGAWR